MWTTVAMWGGVAGLVVSVIAIIIIFLTRKSIVDILDKDVIMFNGNFEIKKNVIEHSFALIDEIITKGEAVLNTADFRSRAEHCYNELLCVVGDIAVANEFHKITISRQSALDMNTLNNFKLLCRKDIGLKVKKSDFSPVSAQPRQYSNEEYNPAPANTQSFQTVNTATKSTTSQPVTPPSQPANNQNTATANASTNTATPVRPRPSTQPTENKK